MHRKTICRCLDGRKPFVITGSSPHYAPDRPFRLEHLSLDVAVDPRAKTLVGSVTQTARVMTPHQRYLQMDQIGLEIQEVKINGAQKKFWTEGPQLWVDLLTAPSREEVLQIQVTYKAQNPRRGIYFTGPDSFYPNKPYQVWTQGQDEDTRYWIPTFDYPNLKISSEVKATVPKGFLAVSNGALVSKQTLADGKTQFHHRLEAKHVTYLISLVVAEFSHWEEKGPRGLPVEFYVAPGREGDGKRAFKNTSLMIQKFEEKIGVPFPYEKYSQVAVQDFIFGGMENTSATTQTDLALFDERAELDFSSDPLVSHELAHQWFGDLVTCRDWSHGWLNEGFATFMERVWVELNPGPHGGIEEAKYYAYQDLREYLADDQSHYRRPIVCNTYIEPIDLFDTHLYQKGGLVVHLIRSLLGDDLFWKSIQHYLRTHRGKNVETWDLIQAIEETTGRNLRRVFDQWVFQAGYPEFEISYSWNEEKKLTEWVIEQKQAPASSVFQLPIRLELTMEDGSRLTHTVEVREARERVFLPSQQRPSMVRFDPGFSIPKTMKFPRPKEMLLYQLEKDIDCMGRIEAAQELGKILDLSLTQKLGQALLNEKFWAVQAEIAKVLGEARSDAARDALISGLSIQHPKARRAVVTALGTYREPNVSDRLRKIAEKDPSYFVEASATSAWATSVFTANTSEIRSDFESETRFIKAQLEKESYREVIRAAALSALADLPGIGKGDRPEALETIMKWTQRGKPTDVRTAAIRALGRIAKTAQTSVLHQIFQVFSELSDEDNFRIRMQLVQTLSEIGNPKAIPVLSKIRFLDTDGRITRGAKTSIDDLTTSGSVPESVSNLKSALEKLEEETRKLRSWVEELRAGNQK